MAIPLKESHHFTEGSLEARERSGRQATPRDPGGRNGQGRVTPGELPAAWGPDTLGAWAACLVPWLRGPRTPDPG